MSIRSLTRTASRRAFIFAILAAGSAVAGRWVWTTFVRPPSKTGFGRGAPGFQTVCCMYPSITDTRGDADWSRSLQSVRKEWVKREDLPADHILRRRVIEEVDERPGAKSSAFAGSSPSSSSNHVPDSSLPASDNEWLPTRPQTQRKSSSNRKR